jgi:hypothetical protein
MESVMSVMTLSLTRRSVEVVAALAVAASGQTLGPQATFAGGRKPDVNGTLWG